MMSETESELQNIGRDNSTFVSNQSPDNKKNSKRKDSQNDSVGLLRFERKSMAPESIH